MKIRVFENIDLLSASLVKLVSKQVKVAINEKKSYFIALSGGNSPQKFYELLNDYLEDRLTNYSKNIGFIQIDERWVSRNHERSNQAMISQNLKIVMELDHYYPIPTPNIYHVIENAVSEYETTLKRILSRFEIINIGIFGMGDDGHTASLFPDDPILNTLTNRLVVSGFINSVGEHRISLTPDFFKHIREKVIIITGSEKGDLLKRALKIQKPFTFPILMVLDDQSLVYMDQEAYKAFNS